MMLERHLTAFPVQLVEVLNGVLGVVLFWMLCFLLMHLAKAAHDASRRNHLGLPFIRVLCTLYRQNKPEIALGILVGALMVRTMVLWYVRWLRDHGFARQDLITENASTILVAATALLVIAVACWIRVITPFSGVFAKVMWMSMIATSLAFSLGMHYLF